MKKKIAAVMLFALMIVFIHPTAKAYEYMGNVYDEDEYNSLVAFLETEAEGVGRKNGQILNSFWYNAANPETWSGVTWSDDTEKKVISIDWEGEGLEGELDLSGFAELKSLNIKGNEITKINLNNDTALEEINCDDTSLTALDLSTNSGLKILYCRNNALTDLDTSAAGNNLKELYCTNNDLKSLNTLANTALMKLYCDNNEITSLDLTSNISLAKLICTDNPLNEVSAYIAGKTVSVKAEGEGYVELMVGDSTTYYAKAALKGTSAFLNWSQASSEIGTNEKYDLTYGNEYDLTANFEGASLPTSSALPTPTPASPLTPTATPTATLTPTPTTSSESTPTATPSESEPLETSALALTADPIDGKMYVGGRMKITPSIEGGTWSFDENYLRRDGETFTVLKEGTVRVLYTVDGQTEYIDVTITADSEIPKTGEDSQLWIVLGTILLMAGAGLGIYLHKKKAS